MTTRRKSGDSTNWTPPTMEAAASFVETGKETSLVGGGENDVGTTLDKKEQTTDNISNIVSVSTGDETKNLSTSVSTRRETKGRSSITGWTSPDMEAAAAMASAKHGDELVSQLASTRKGFTPPSSLSTALPSSSDGDIAPSEADSSSISIVKNDGTSKRPSASRFLEPQQAPRSSRGTVSGGLGETSSRTAWFKNLRGSRGAMMTTTIQQNKPSSAAVSTNAVLNTSSTRGAAEVGSISSKCAQSVVTTTKASQTTTSRSPTSPASARVIGATSPSDRYATKIRCCDNERRASEPGAWIVQFPSPAGDSTSSTPSLGGERDLRSGEKSNSSTFPQPFSRSIWTRKRRSDTVGTTKSAPSSHEDETSSSSIFFRGFHLPRARPTEKVGGKTRMSGGAAGENSSRMSAVPGAVRIHGRGYDGVVGGEEIISGRPTKHTRFSQPTGRLEWLIGRKRQTLSNDADAQSGNAMASWDDNNSARDHSGEGAVAADWVVDDEYNNNNGQYDENDEVANEDESNFDISERVAGHEQEYDQNMQNLSHFRGATFLPSHIREGELLMQGVPRETDVHTPNEAPVALLGKDGLDVVSRKRWQRCLIILLVFLMAVGIFVGVSVAFVDGDGGGEESSSQGDGSIQAVPTTSPTVNLETCFGAESDGAPSERYSTLRLELQSMYTKTRFDVPNTPQRMALCWLADFDRLQVDLLGVSSWHQRYILSVLFYSLVDRDDPEGLALKSNWLSPFPECNWDYVDCRLLDDKSTVTELNLDDKFLRGTIPDEISELSLLRILDLSYNSIGGSLSTLIGDMRSLTSIQLNGNSISGTIPTGIGQLTQLASIKIDGNLINGTIPSEIGSLTNLVNLYLDGNSISNAIPASIGQLSKLERLTLSGNHINGTIPSELYRLIELEELSAHTCELSGTISSLIRQLTNLEILSLVDNDLNGTLPSEIGDIMSLTVLHLNNNHFVGTIPQEFGNLENIEFMRLEYNDLTGTMPESICALRNSMKRLVMLSADCEGSELTCSRPSCCTDCY